ncbi:ATP-binding cassette domain-containing protein [Deinococcus sp.]|uniref:ABC transporter ATP-binding protein n=1 Tax=Deinococcus sp. TaxID=47478 RepID=UPI0025CF29A2|nr:ATP-binding cassette domain-containing protein [Deinococcus sp.]
MSSPERADKDFAVQLRGAWLRLGREVILRGVDLDVTSGEGLTLIGENGAGKTTLLRLLASSLRLTRGEGRVHGFDLRDSRSVREFVHLMPVEGGAYPDLSAEENLRFALRMHRLEGDTGAALRRVGLEKAAGRRVRFLSAGMRKRLSLARLSLLARPLTLVDEPFANLDQAGRQTALDILSEVRQRGQTLILAAHEPELAAQVASRTLLLRAGLLTEQR